MRPFYSWGNRGPTRAVSGLTTQAESSPRSLPQAWVIPRPPLHRRVSEGMYIFQKVFLLCNMTSNPEVICIILELNINGVFIQFFRLGQIIKNFILFWPS